MKQVAESWWVDFESHGVSPGTLRLYRGRLDNHVLPGLGHLRIQELTVGRIHRHLSVLAENHGPGTARTTRAILSGICGFAAQRDALERNPVRDAGPARSDAPKRLPRSLTIEQARQLRALLSYDDEAVHRDLPDFVGFILATGCRIGEALALTWDAIDFEAGTVEIRGTKTAAGQRNVRLPSWCIEMLESRKSNDLMSSDNRLVFPTSTGRVRDGNVMRRWLKAAFERAGFPAITSHTLRKSVATLMDGAGLSARAAADQLGHTRPSVTADVYFGRQVADTGAAQVLESLAL